MKRSTKITKKLVFSFWCLSLGVALLGGLSASGAAVTQDNSGVQAGSATEPASDSVVPRLIQYSGAVKDTEGKPVTGSVGLTFSLYQFQEGGRPLWVETQTVQPDSQGHYSVLLGAASPDGLPQDLFSSGSARWLAVQPALPGAAEQPRVLLVGVPYALKAADAETLGGKPASAYVTTETLDASGASAATGSGASASAIPAAIGAQDRSTARSSRENKKAGSTSPLVTSCSSITADGTATANQVAKFTAACKIHQSLLFDNGTDVGVGTTSPAATLDVNGNISGRANLSLPQTFSSTAGVINMAGSPFIHMCCTAGGFDTFVGLGAGDFTTKGSVNTAVGHDALAFISSGTENTANGASALSFTSAGNENTASGFAALESNTTGTLNSALGAHTDVSSGNLSNATAIGAFARVAESNAILLGCVSSNCASGTSQPNVGIGTTTPLAPLDVLPLNDSIHILLGNVGCGNSNAGIIFATTLNENCQTYAISGDTAGNTYVDAPGGELHLRISPNTDAMVIDTHANATISGNLTVKGSLSKGSGSFKIDHPLDPANKYLYHSFVESPDMMNIYNGNATTNKQGLAVVVLPNYFEALNRDFRYQLTPIGQFAQVIVAKKIANNRFVIRTSKPRVEVSWQVTGIRHDAYAAAHRIPVEEEKPLQERGKYLHPELFGAPAEKAVGYSAPLPSPAAVTLVEAAPSLK